MEALQSLVEQARQLIAEYDAIDEDDVSYKADEERGILEQAGYDLLTRIVEHLS